jgi:diguanylate cyclase (GGDEF)-like protein
MRLGMVADRRSAGRDADELGDDRDLQAEAHDRESEARDERADARDERAEIRERSADSVDAEAAADRAEASGDRREAAGDRASAADDRRAAAADRSRSAQEREAASIDLLTHTRRREQGLAEIERELARAKRTNRPFALAFVDVNGLKRTNDSLGHAAGDELLRQTADVIRSRLRSYDLIVRFGGDEFLCALLDVTIEQAAERFSLVNADLASAEKASISVGLAELQADDDLETLIARADRAMYSEREQRR